MVELPELEMEQTEEESKYKQAPENDVSIEIEGLPSEDDNEK